MSKLFRLALDRLLTQRGRTPFAVLPLATVVPTLAIPHRPQDSSGSTFASVTQDEDPRASFFTALSIAFAFALPWTKDITSEQWIIRMGALMAAFAISGMVVWVLGLRRASSVSAEADLAQYAVEEA